MSKRKSKGDMHLEGHVGVEEIPELNDDPQAMTVDEAVAMAKQLFLEEEEADVGKKRDKKPSAGFKPATKAGGKEKVQEFMGYGGGGYTNPKGTTTTLACPIHTGDKVVFSLNGGQTTVAGAEKPHIKPAGAALVIDLTGAGFSSFSSAPPRDFVESEIEWFPVAELNALAKPMFADPPAPYVNFDWKDMSVPPVGYEFWVKLVDSLPLGHVIVYCQGGHGRTGTALAAMLAVTTNLSHKAIVDEVVRKVHCHKALETEAQVKYIEKLCAFRDKLAEAIETEAVAKALA